MTELLSFNLVLIWYRAETSLQEARGKGVGIQESSKTHLLWAQHMISVKAHPKSGRASLPTFKPFIVLLIVTLVTVLEIFQWEMEKDVAFLENFQKSTRCTRLIIHMSLITNSKFYYDKDVFAVIS